jgi:octaprenyl-diphosphate synthase
LNREASGQELRFLKEHQAYLERIEAGLYDLMRKYESHPLYQPMMYSLEGGKRLRPLVVMLVNEALGPSGEDPLPVSSAVELLHTVSLIHDDIIDREASRRDRQPYYRQFGVDSALLSADFVLGIILDVASRYEDRAVGAELAKAAVEMSAGEEDERKLVRNPNGVTWTKYIGVLEQKTASLFRASAVIGALLSRKKELSHRLSDFGFKLGMAYQLRDDLADINKPNELISLLKSKDQSAVQRVTEAADVYSSKSLDVLRDLPESPALFKLEKLVEKYF